MHVVSLISRKFLLYADRAYSLTLGLVLQAMAFVLRKPRVMGEKRTAIVYEDVFDFLGRREGCPTDYTGGHYSEGNDFDPKRLCRSDTSYTEEEHTKYLKSYPTKVERILGDLRIGSKSTLLEIGGGLGRMLLAARDRGAEVHGVTLAKTQVEACQKVGADYRVGTVHDVHRIFPEKTFDAILMNGTTEHFIQANVRDKISQYEKLYARLVRLLKDRGRIVLTSLHVRKGSFKVRDAAAYDTHPLWDIFHYGNFGSCSHQFATLTHFFAGTYPLDGEYVSIFEKLGLTTLVNEDRTEDYFQSSVIWNKMYDSFTLENRSKIFSLLWTLFKKDPMLLYAQMMLSRYKGWPWQFTTRETYREWCRDSMGFSPEESHATPEPPMINRYLVFEKKDVGAKQTL